MEISKNFLKFLKLCFRGVFYTHALLCHRVPSPPERLGGNAIVFSMICHALLWCFRRHPDLHHIGVVLSITSLILVFTLEV